LSNYLPFPLPFACAKSDPATDFSVLVLFGFLKISDALVATLGDVCFLFIVYEFKHEGIANIYSVWLFTLPARAHTFAGVLFITNL
jgi:hypothetical protein